MRFSVDLTQLPLAERQSILQTLHRDDLAKLALAKVRQAKIAQAFRDAAAPGTTKEGIGPMSLAIDPYFVQHFRLLYGDRIFEDDEFAKFLKARGEWFHVPEKGTRVQIGWTGERRVKDRKVYL